MRQDDVIGNVEMIPLRDENPSRSFPLVTLTIIIVNVLVFLYELRLGSGFEKLVMQYAAVPYDLTHNIFQPKVMFTLLTSLFLHGGLTHILGNMLYLWVFGNNIEDRLGHLRFILFYCACGVFATMGYVMFAVNSKLPLIGASGAISGVLGAYLILYPRAKILVLLPFFLFWRIIKVSAGWFLIFWIALQFIYGTGSRILMDASNESAVAWFAHIGGFFAGIFLLWVLSPAQKKYRNG